MAGIFDFFPIESRSNYRVYVSKNFSTREVASFFPCGKNVHLDKIPESHYIDIFFFQRLIYFTELWYKLIM